MNGVKWQTSFNIGSPFRSKSLEMNFTSLITMTTIAYHMHTISLRLGNLSTDNRLKGGGGGHRRSQEIKKKHITNPGQHPCQTNAF